MQPRSLFASILHLLRLRPGLARAALLGFAALGLSCGVVIRCGAGPSVELATFNIRDFPKGGAPQVEGAFEMIAALEVPLIAVEEITDRPRFTREAQARLGSHWRTEFGPRDEVESSAPELAIGLLYDARRFEVRAARLHPQPGHRDDRPGRPVLEVELETLGGGSNLRVFVVHFKSRGGHSPTRNRQLAALMPIVRAANQGSDEVVVLGDFNATGAADRRNIERFVRDTELHWASEGLECTAYWQPGNTCQGSALDHVLTSRPGEAAARGPCEAVGCEPGESCPIFVGEVSDHCPVTAKF